MVKDTADPIVAGVKALGTALDRAMTAAIEHSMSHMTQNYPAEALGAQRSSRVDA